MSFQASRSSWPKGVEEAVKAATVTEIVKQITQTKEWTAEMVMEIFCRQALDAQEECNALTQHWMDRAIRQARALDADFERTGTPKGALHGVPFSVKEQIDVEGTVDATLGFSRFLGEPASRSALVVRILESAGAIPFCKTNLPQGNMAFETSNPVYGTTLHPMNPSLSPGGSSGGEAALIASCGSPLGLGTDIEGGLRVPASFCGLYALKPSSNRIPLQGVRNNLGGPDALRLCLGPIGTSVQDLARVLEAIIDARPWNDDSKTLPIPWGLESEKEPNPPRFGYYTDDGLIRATPACTRAVSTAVLALEAAGYECVPFAPPDVPEAISNFYALLSADGLSTAVGPKGRDPIDPALAPFIRLAGTPNWLKGVHSRLLRFSGDEALAGVMSAIQKRDVAGLWSLQRAQQEYQAKFHAMKTAAKIDAIIAPVHALPVVTHDCFADIPFAGSFSVLYNFLDYSAGVIPVTTVDPTNDTLSERTSMMRSSRGKWTKLERAVFRHYDPHLFADVPVGVQVVTGRLQEERCLNMMALVDNALAQSRGKTPAVAQAEANAARSRRYSINSAKSDSTRVSSSAGSSNRHSMTRQGSSNSLKTVGRRVSFADDLDQRFKDEGRET
ncbi:glutaminyl-tRNA synthase (glutamine-hydrolysing) [Synchytrium microbalum]|uniref:amidase n=1 Tax=Synchytrium microbalum TaxID=1806994 RepID=A0A507BP03_9FUNG|nr:glutaminyl-tRNA synthase (glutamine-hydrolysing) [Synchytrium microbalum]TPX31147.1 glutaminyl-tRNA synthase (glutamine-hydrolysing) [Synchytrium microbalum]